MLREERREHEKDVKRMQCVMRFDSLGNALCLAHQNSGSPATRMK